MKIVLLAPACSIHTVKWANGLADRGIEVYLISAHDALSSIRAEVVVHRLSTKAPFSYFLSGKEVRMLLDKIKPNLVNAHYATGYGLLARSVIDYPLLLSVWGSDVYDFPLKSGFHRCLLRKNLQHATALASTSYAMAKETQKIFKHPHVFITPFGVDEHYFCPDQRPKVKNSEKIVIGTVKTLANKYGIDTLIQAFALVCSRYSSMDLVLKIAGAGPELANLKNLVTSLSLNDKVIFYGQINHQEVPDFLNQLDIYLALSRLNSESFGVAILEASSCQIPVIVSDADGPAEVTKDNITGFIVQKNAPEQAAQAIAKLIDNPELRLAMGQNGRKHVLANYTWTISLDLMLKAYNQTIEWSKPANHD